MTTVLCRYRRMLSSIAVIGALILLSEISAETPAAERANRGSVITASAHQVNGSDTQLAGYWSTVTAPLLGWSSLPSASLHNAPRVTGDAVEISEPRVIPPVPSAEWSPLLPTSEITAIPVEEFHDPAAAYAPAPGHYEYEPHSEREESWQLMPDGLLFKTYIAGVKEPRFSSVWLNEKGRGLIWETSLGGRVGLIRHGTVGAVRPEGWQLDLEGAVFARLDPEANTDLDAADFRVGIPMTWRRGPTAVKFGYFHISSHLGDEFLLRNPEFTRLNYVRDSFIVGISQDIGDDFRLYGEAAYAAGAEGGAEPWEFQAGAEYSPRYSTGKRPHPFAAINFHVRQEFFGDPSLNLMYGLEWRSAISDRTFRVGGQYYNGKSLQYSFFDKHEELAGFGMWFDY